jgi:hypothetical protein
MESRGLSHAGMDPRRHPRGIPTPVGRGTTEPCQMGHRKPSPPRQPRSSKAGWDWQQARVKPLRQGVARPPQPNARAPLPAPTRRPPR